MKKLLIIALLFFTVHIQAQNIVRMEYWVDKDPGFGLATNISGFTPSTDVSSFEFSISGNLSEGAHVVGIRSLDADGFWSHSNTFFVQVTDSSIGKIVGIEYY